MSEKRVQIEMRRDLHCSSKTYSIGKGKHEIVIDVAEASRINQPEVNVKVGHSIASLVDDAGIAVGEVFIGFHRSIFA